MVTALAPKLDEIKQLGARMHTWLAGPDPAPAELIRAMAAVEVLRTTLAAAARPELPEAEVRRVVLDAAVGVLGLRQAASRDHEVAAAS
jgi:hypothetical protein